MQTRIIHPNILFQELPAFDSSLQTIIEARNTIKNILYGLDKRLLVIVGPCSIHDTHAALEYASLLKKEAERYADELFIVMRVYFEKPRTTLGWKGLISDPHLNGNRDVTHGLRLARQLLLDLANLGVPAGSEFLDTIIPQYLSDLVSWCAIGARTSESQLHRELASGLAMPIGFKNTTDGNIKIAVEAVCTAQHTHHYLSINSEGQPVVIQTPGNKDGHIILRGSRYNTNHSEKYVEKAAELLQEANIKTRLLIDCSHGNSQKNYLYQHQVIHSVARQLQQTNYIAGVMIESNLVAGSQTLSSNQSLVYGQSVTDACLSWSETVPLLDHLAMVARYNKKMA